MHVKFNRLVGKLFKLKWFSSNYSDCAKKQYDALIQTANNEWKNKFLQFKIFDNRIDSFFTEFEIQMLLGSI